MSKRNHNSRESALRRGALFFTAVGMSVFALGYIVGHSNAKDAEFYCPEAPIIVNDGDTVYDLARSLCTGNFISVVDEVVNTYGSNIRVGQKIFLPTHNNCALRITNDGQVYEDCK